MFDEKFLIARKADLKQSQFRIEKELEKFTKTKGKGKGRKAIFPSIGDQEDEAAQEVEMYESALSVEKSLSHRLKDINQALEKFENNAYGKCEIGGEDIEKERLEAYPGAKTCLKHSQK
jgi:DnaK suppressor protein